MPHEIQMLSGHGVFATYRYRIRKTDDPRCENCDDGDEDNPAHILSTCPRWAEYRGLSTGKTECGPALSANDTDIDGAHAGGQETVWRAVSQFYTTVVAAKEWQERARGSDERRKRWDKAIMALRR